MSLDTKWRPRTYDDVLGQAATIQILRRLVITGRQFQQSYLFAGPWGSGKTTTARIFARAMLCDAPVEGNPCDQCLSCQAILENGLSESLTEVDAATNSGKDDIRKVLEEIEYSTFSGKRRIYIYDESHQLSPGALDGMLKALEENVSGSGDKKLVCIFCTTEPERMRATVLSRCAPAFIIHPVSPREVADRLAKVCQAEGLEHDLSSLQLIAEMTECHVRDCLKAVEGVSMLGPINGPNVSKYMHLDRHVLYLEVLESLGGDFKGVSKALDNLLQQASAVTCYEKLAEAALLAYKVSVGACAVPGYWDAERVQKIGARLGTGLLAVSGTLASRPGRVTAAMLECDLAYLHHRGRAPVAESSAMSFLPAPVSLASPAPSASMKPNSTVAVSVPISSTDGTLSVPEPSAPGSVLRDGIYVEGRAVKALPARTPDSSARPLELDAATFMRIVEMRVAELDGGLRQRGSTGPSFLDRH